ncbi:bifunctional DedA family/phosphatase PAP2 family protein [Alcaligenes faecalis]|uniref:bifunctional DedA family/phosphatase PAP2 family protein n=1 Tax=Alcaligenes faecalis TaxID=511 RepID=UPI0024BBF02B|nr:bifunctional DedA family/phosphatase PAP2 family protein [Alcaligenes faecalis]WHQ45953.1 phosphatase PAP2 family protein [Alcaligenes faecalis]
MLNYLIELVTRAGHWGYLVIFLGATLESAAFLGVIVPGESLVLVAGFLAAQGVFDLDVLIMIIAIGAAVGDSLGYEMGRWLGRPALLRYGGRFGLGKERIARADAFFTRHGGKAVFLGRFVGFARALVPFLAGSSRMSYRRFLPYNVLGALLWSAAVTLLGYFLGASWQLAAGWIGKASAILGGILVFALGLVWLWRWAMRHEAALRSAWSRFLLRPRVAALCHRFDPQLAFIKARLSPDGYLGLRLSVGAAILIAASWLFGGIAEDVLTGDPITVMDVHIAQWLHAHAAPWLTLAMQLVSMLHDTMAMTIMTMAFAAILIAKRYWYWLLNLILAVPGGMLVNVLMKQAFQRTRPVFDHPLVNLTSYSFPSGHTVASTLFYGMLAALIISKTASWSRRVWTVLLAFAIVSLVAFSRLYLGAHYLSDVLAALAEGLAWLALCLTGTHTYWEQKQRSAS